MGAPAPVIHWFRQDLRLADNPALLAAAADGRPVIPLFIRDWVESGDGDYRRERGTGGGRGPGGASRWWLHGSLSRLDAALRSRGSRLILHSGPVAEVLAALARETGATALHWNRVYEPGEGDLARALHQCLPAGLEVKAHSARLLHEPAAIRTAAGRPYQVFTPFWRACLTAPPPRVPEGEPASLPAPDHWPASERLADWDLHPSSPDWSAGLAARFNPGEVAALARLDEVLGDTINDYPKHRDRPDWPGTSRLSPHLHFGELSAAQVWRAVNAAAAAGEIHQSAAGAYLRQLIWREFAAHLLLHFPSMPEQPLQPEFSAFPWRPDAAHFQAWCRGRTGYPIVDAGMRELWHTGWMHNRVRMITASFLVKDLLIPWQQGEAWFWDTLVDADLANNAVSWQWVAGCGADAAPFFRIFNPVLQGRKFDPAGAYIRRWVPELARLPDPHLHTPWLAPEAVRRAAGLHLGWDYPAPLVDHAAARDRALAAFRQLRAPRAADVHRD